MFFKQQWQASPAVKDSNYNAATQPFLLINDTAIDDLDALSNASYKVSYGTQFVDSTNGYFIIDPTQAADWAMLLDSLVVVPTHVVFIANNNEEKSENIFLTICHFIQALAAAKLQNIRVLFFHHSNSSNSSFAALDGLFKCLAIEKPGYQFQCIEIDSASLSSISLSNIIASELSLSSMKYSIKYVRGERFTKQLMLLDKQPTVNADFVFSSNHIVHNGTYLITGGLGALGTIFARHLINNFQANVILCGRSALTPEKSARLTELGPRAFYVEADISKVESCLQLVAQIKQKYSRLNGVIHSAGVLQDNFVLNIKAQDINAVLASKVVAAENLVSCLKNESLNFFSMFSSWAGVTGNEGQGVYAYGNSYLNYFAEELVNNTPHLGKVITIAWPLWDGDGMGVNPDIHHKLLTQTGMTPLQEQQGISAFHHALNNDAAMLSYFSGEPKNLDLERIIFTTAPVAQTDTTDDVHLSPAIIQACDNFLRKLVADESGLVAAQINKHRPFDELGLDSVMISRLNNQLALSFKELSKTIFFECQNLAELTQWFLENRTSDVKALFNISNKHSSALKQEDQEVFTGSLSPEPSDHLPRTRKLVLDQFRQYVGGTQPPGKSRFVSTKQIHAVPEPIAIIGCSGRYPQADDLNEFWQNLMQGKDSITEIPQWRWNHDLYFDPKGENGKTYAKWGGFINDVEAFDPLFFNISPKDAAYLDPQDRLFLQTAWHTLEDAGYTRDTLKNNKVGVYVGVMWAHYQLYGPLLSQQGDHRVPASSFASIANRVSYFMDFTGPSIALDTMCSSSLTALHLACEALRSGGCEYALVGGVNLSIHPQKYLYLGQGKFPSSDGRCRSFGDGGDGYVPGEGVGGILLKPLTTALQDGDSIYGVIRGSALNHGGKTNGYTVPNPKAQFSVIASAFAQAQVSPESISYIESHGTGTALGDPIEISGLNQVFGERVTNDKPIAIGSVKSNIGHLEAAAGIASLTKVLLQFKAQTLVPSLHSTPPNSNINFASLPFKVQIETQAWQANGNFPRRACISSFGAGGSNAHIILEEYSPVNVSASNETTSAGPYLFVLSAKTEDALRNYSDAFVRSLTQGSLSNALIQDICFSAQTTREEFDNRLALVATDHKELLDKLKRYAAGEKNIPQLYSGNINSSQLQSFLAGQEELTQEIALALLKTVVEKKSQWDQVARLWMTGTHIEWAQAYALHTYPTKIRLPLYPFAKEPCWLNLENLEFTRKKPEHATRHPLLGENVSNFYEQKYIISLHKELYFLNDHKFENSQMLPGAAIVEMVLRAAEEASEGKFNRISNLQWLAPVVVGADVKQLSLVLEPKHTADSETIAFELYETPNLLRVYSKGIIETMLPVDLGSLNLQNILARCTQAVAAENCYQLFEAYGLSYGAHFRTVKELQLGEDEALARVSFNVIPADKDLQKMHICLLDGVLQTVIGLVEKDELVALSLDKERIISEQKSRLLPRSITTLIFEQQLPEILWVHIQVKRNDKDTPIENNNNDEFRFNINISDAAGKIIALIEDFCLGAVTNNTAADQKNDLSSTLYFQRSWKPSPTDWQVHSQVEKLTFSNLLVIDNSEIIFQQLRQSHSENLIHNAIPQYSWTQSGSFPESELFDFNDDNGFQKILHRNGIPDLVVLHLPALLPAGISYSLATTAALQNIYRIVQCLLLGDNKKEIRVLIVAPLDHIHTPVCAGISGLFDTAAKEFNHFTYRVLEIDPAVMKTSETEIVDFSALINVELVNWKINETRSKISSTGVREILRLEEINLPSMRDIAKNKQSNIGVVRGGTYLISGGAGALGFIFAKHFAALGAGKIILVGRRPLNNSIQRQLDELAIYGVSANYCAIDLSLRKEVEEFFNLEQRQGKINGVIHAAGFIKDSLIRNKAATEFSQVIAPKVTGTINLIEAIADIDLDFFVAFSSVAAIVGNIGQADYAAANAFMDAYLDIQKNRYRTLTINWPLWSEGMQVDQHTLDYLKDSMGMQPLLASTGIEIFDKLLLSNFHQAIVLQGNGNILRQNLLPSNIKNLHSADVNATTASDLPQRIENYLYKIVSSLLGLDKDRILVDVSLENYGVDSAATINLINILEQDVGKLSKTLLFEYSTIGQLTEYFIQNHSLVLNKILSGNDNERKVEIYNNAAPATVESRIAPRPYKTATYLDNKLLVKSSYRDKRADIAIIGVAGQYPKAANLDEFWNNLKSGRDCIAEIPTDRWNHDQYFDADKKSEGKIYAKWGGFLKNIDCFDALFFKISPREAELMDPQERLFLQTVWHTLEDAGYPPAMLAKQKVGVFVGAMWNQYQLLGLNSHAGKPGYLAPNSSIASIANRISYVFDFRGPSLSLDSMCSSSLSSLHLACESIQRGESELAIAGGVNLNLHENKYFQLSQNRFLSSDGRCRSFGADGDGYVPGEGVGAVILKKLEDAEKDGDQIHGVILGSAINHGGRTKGYTVPSPSSQAEVISAALKNSQVNANDIDYVEAHGTGTSLGDPIEIEGLANGLKGHSNNTFDNKIIIGSVKSNIGHLEGAAGIAALTKVLLQYRNKQLAPSINSEPANPNIDFSSGNFKVQTTLSEWNDVKSESIHKDNSRNSFVRIAGISSFGAGGSNAHIILGDYVKRPALILRSEDDLKHIKENIFLLSGKDQQDLSLYAESFIAKIETMPDDVHLTDICFSLQIGREHFTHRLAIVCSDREDLLMKLKFFLSKKPEKNIFCGEISASTKNINTLNIDELNLQKIADAWIKGQTINWRDLYANENPKRISLPGYPFKQERYWYNHANTIVQDVLPNGWENLTLVHDSAQSAVISTKITPASYWIQDHVIHNQPILPGAVNLELARESFQLSRVLREKIPYTPNALKDVFWLSPLTGSAENIEIHLTTDSNADLRFTIKNVSTEVEFCQGYLTKLSLKHTFSGYEPKHYNRAFDQQTLYKIFADYGFAYGPSLTVINEVFYRENEVVGELTLPMLYFKDEDFGLSPAAIDGAFQACLALHLADDTSLKSSDIRYIPLSVREIIFDLPLSRNLRFQVLRKQGASKENVQTSTNSFITKYDVTCIDHSGKTVVCLIDFTVLGQYDSIVKKPVQENIQESAKPMFFKTTWEYSN